MKIKCPKCRAEYDVLEAAKEEDLREIIRMQGDFGAQSAIVLEYCEKFETTRPVKVKKLLRILREVRDIWTSERFTFQRRVYRISQKGMVTALRTICNKSFDGPLTGHNYLKRILITESEKESIEAEKALMERERRLRAGERPGRGVRGREDKGGEPTSIGEITKNLPWRRK